MKKNFQTSTFTPIIFSIIFYAANGANHISYVDALFNCVSAVCVCGLTTIDLSSLTPFQQFLLFFQSAIGSPVSGKPGDVKWYANTYIRVDNSFMGDGLHKTILFLQKI